MAWTIRPTTSWRPGPNRPATSANGSEQEDGPLQAEGAHPRSGYLQVQRPAVDAARVEGGRVADAEVPRAVGGLARQVHGVGLVDVVGTAAGPVGQVVHRTVRGDEVD